MSPLLSTYAYTQPSSPPPLISLLRHRYKHDAPRPPSQPILTPLPLSPRALKSYVWRWHPHAPLHLGGEDGRVPGDAWALLLILRLGVAHAIELASRGKHAATEPHGVALEGVAHHVHVDRRGLQHHKAHRNQYQKPSGDVRFIYAVRRWTGQGNVQRDA